MISCSSKDFACDLECATVQCNDKSPSAVWTLQHFYTSSKMCQLASQLETNGHRDWWREKTKTCPLSSSCHSGTDVLWPQPLTQSIVHRLVLLSCVGALCTQTSHSQEPKNKTTFKYIFTFHFVLPSKSTALHSVQLPLSITEAECRL